MEAELNCLKELELELKKKKKKCGKILGKKRKLERFENGKQDITLNVELSKPLEILIILTYL